MLCRGCHDLRIADVLPLARDFDRAGFLADDESCVGCHMERTARTPAAGGPPRSGRSHRLLGPADAAFCASALLMRAERHGGAPVLAIHNGAGHGVPGLARLRSFAVHVALLDADGKVLASRDLAGVHFTGSTGVFNHIWGKVGANIARYGQYPRLIGETGGKDFVFAHSSAEPDSLAVALVRGAYEYQGQKCSAASRAFIPASLWPAVQERLLQQIAEIRLGDPADFTNFMGAVIDANAFATIKGYIDHARQSPDAAILAGGGCDDGKGYFVEPTVVLAKRPGLKLMREEIFGPVLTVWVYEDRDLETALEICDSGSPYALTGAVFARDRAAIVRIADALTHAAGNFYVNDKPTGAVVGQQPFGGARASGTNDKAGSVLNLLRWVSPRAIKETFVPPTDFRYPFMAPGD